MIQTHPLEARPRAASWRHTVVSRSCVDGRPNPTRRIHVGLFAMVLATVIVHTFVLGIVGNTLQAATTDTDKAEFFRVFDFTNASLLAHNPGLTAVSTELAQPSPDYAAAMASLWTAIPGQNYSGGLSRVKADPGQFAQNFFSWINLDHPGL